MKKIILEEIKTMKKLMVYDTSKTLTENIEKINEVKGLVGGVDNSGSGNAATTGNAAGSGNKNKSRQTASQYKTCPETFPIDKWCNNSKIKEIQVKLGMATKYHTGNFGPLTEKAILAKIPDFKVANGITQDDYNKIMGIETKEKSADDDYIDVAGTPQPDNKDVVDIPNITVDPAAEDEGT